MSLKAKIEAVIYAAEEPVTLAQLAGLFAAEALLSAKAPERADAVEDEEPLPALSVESLIETGIVETGFFDAGGFAAGGTADNDALAAQALVGRKSVEAVNAEAEERRAARQRDREVRERLRAIVAELIEEYAHGDRGMEVREIAGGYRIATKPEYHDAVRSFVKSLKPPMKLSLQALETLAVIAYKQPVTAPEVGEIRGVDSAGVLGSLMSRKLITTAGRKQVIGRPILYKTTKEFLLRFGLKDLNELPSIEEFEKMAGEIELEEDAAPESAGLAFGGDDTEEQSEAVEANAGEPGLSVASEAETEAQEYKEQVVTVALDADALHAPGSPAETSVHPVPGDSDASREGV